MDSYPPRGAGRDSEPTRVEAGPEIIVYNPQRIQSWHQGKLKSHHYIRHLYSEWKFKNSSRYGFFEQYIVPELTDRLRLGQPVVEIDYAGETVRLRTAHDQRFEADKLLITVPLTILQSRQIDFIPPLPAAKTEAIDGIFMGDGIKIFVEFSERFYPDFLAFGPIFQALAAEEKFVYDAAFRKDSDQHILGLFAINEPAAPYTRLGSEADIIAQFLAELDEMFAGQASKHYQQYIIQNWSAEPFMQGAYSYSFSGNQRQTVEAITAPLQNKIYFAGEAFSLDNQAMVHGACESAFAAVALMLVRK
jgi:monoamine oxidase